MMKADARVENPRNEGDLSQDEIPGSISTVRSPAVAALVQSFESSSWATLFFRCMTCCNCILLFILTILFIYEMGKVNSLDSIVQEDQATIAELQNEVREKQQVKIDELHQQVEQEHNLTFLSLAGIMTLLTCLVTMFHMSSHLQKMEQPLIQRKILAILWMSPIYSVTSFLTLLYPPIEGYMAIIKDFYESYCIYTFLSFLIVVLGRGSRDNAVEVLAMRAHQLQQPTRLLSRWYEPPPDTSDIAKANAVITECQIYAMQFVFLRPLTTVISVIYQAVVEENSSKVVVTATNGSGYRWLQQAMNATAINAPTPTPLSAPTLAPEETLMIDGHPALKEATVAYFKSFSFFLAMIVNISVFFAFAALLKFYHSVHNDLAWMRPWPKFLTIKGVVFLTFWQGLVILILVNLNEYTGDASDGDSTEDPSERASRIQNILICCEMLFFSLTHWCVFPAEEWAKGYEPPTRSHQPGIAIQDFVSDVGQIYRRRRRRRPSRFLPGSKRSPRHEGIGVYHRTGLGPPNEDSDEFSELQRSFSNDRGSRNRSHGEDSSKPYKQNDDLRLDEEPEVVLGNLTPRNPRNRRRLPSEGSSVKADDEDDGEMELI